jgi:CDP-diacylglycerol--glycerol-3-phosphate 3-phosphatidyltransferase
VAQPPLTARRLLGLDRSGGPPPGTTKGQPLNPWTVPNAIGFVRLALIPVFLAFAFSSGDGRSVPAAILFLSITATDYFDGMIARITGQYSRLGALLDPLVDRLAVVSGVVVAWSFDLLPHWALALLAAREVFMLVATRVVMWRGADLAINMLGRWAVWPTMFSLFLAMLTDTWVAGAFLFLGLAMTLVATVQYVRNGRRALAPPSTSA